MTGREDLTKVVVDLPNHWATGGESMWAKPLGEDLYELHNVPFYAYGLNYLDVVRAVEPAPDLIPMVERVVAPSGHRTLRVLFDADFPESKRIPLLETLSPMGAGMEGADSRYFAIDIGPDGDYDGVQAQLDSWQEEGVLGYETCEPRADGSFDDLPEASD